MGRPIAISLAPNMEKDDVWLALKMLFSPINWFNFRITEKLENKFAHYFGMEYKALAVNSGRSAEYLILKSLGIGKGNEVVIQAFTCVVVANPILWLGATPVYIDIDKTFNLDSKKLSEKISENTRAIIIQHTFGIPANLDLIKKVAQKKRIPIIEDCAVSLGALYKKQKVGTFGKVAFFSFGRDKVISSVFGGMILTKDNNLYKNLKRERDKLDYPSPFWLIQQLIHPLAFSIILPLYNLGYKNYTLGKILLVFLQKLRLVSKAIYKDEIKTKKPKYFPQKMPGVIAQLALNQFMKLEKFNTSRRKNALKYFKLLKNEDFILPEKVSGSIWLRFPVLVKDPKKMLDFAKKNKIILGDWYKEPVVPVSNLNTVNYAYGSCPQAEKSCQTIINLPTYPLLNVKDIDKIVKVIKNA